MSLAISTLHLIIVRQIKHRTVKWMEHVARAVETDIYFNLPVV
jgi:hypothetical protein